ncbi:hypothetical protein O6H91_16G068700 [Diphasiastrum complanatum]|uniref:Uncharacterized protein n=2 Tax=Diphasiastrum complanatum TaxID=34168 RepID=A0ACC2BDF4_DIPCM|nr:hypothetical protein O6H91_16G068600 [Diphasiastrum complanatum]KAJ7527738.1 hypothetical protein O6H91_16G068700 [Diphasiastrum complanatum]
MNLMSLPSISCSSSSSSPSQFSSHSIRSNSAIHSSLQPFYHRSLSLRLSLSLKPQQLHRIRSAATHVVASAIADVQKIDRSSNSLAEDAVLPISQTENSEDRRKFDWNSHWYPVAIAANLDKRLPHAATIMGHDLVVWWDRIGGTWQVFKDKCPHRLAPLSEGRISEEGHLQCSYHGWKFSPCSGSCSFIPQAPADGPKVHTSKRACATPYPSLEQQGLVWFWPDPKEEARSLAASRLPPKVAELDDPSFTHQWIMRDMPFGFEVLIENLMDPSHVPFAHHKLQGDRNKANPIALTVGKVEPSGFEGQQERGNVSFIAPCFFIYGGSLDKTGTKTMQSEASKESQENHALEKKKKQVLLVFWCLPISPGKSRLIWNFPRNFGLWLNNVIPTWLNHLQRMLVLDSDMYLLHCMENKIQEAGTWETVCYLPTLADTFVIAFRSWLRLYGGHPEWGSKQLSNTLPPTTSKEQLMDRYSSHVKQCPDCMNALNFLRGAEVFMQALSIASVAILAIASLKPMPIINASSVNIGCFAVFCCVASRMIPHFIQKNYFFHDYIHAHVK